MLGGGAAAAVTEDPSRSQGVVYYESIERRVNKKDVGKPKWYTKAGTGINKTVDQLFDVKEGVPWQVTPFKYIVLDLGHASFKTAKPRFKITHAATSSQACVELPGLEGKYEYKTKAELYKAITLDHYEAKPPQNPEVHVTLAPVSGGENVDLNGYLIQIEIKQFPGRLQHEHFFILEATSEDGKAVCEIRLRMTRTSSVRKRIGISGSALPVEYQQQIVTDIPGDHGGGAGARQAKLRMPKPIGMTTEEVNEYFGWIAHKQAHEDAAAVLRSLKAVGGKRDVTEPRRDRKKRAKVVIMLGVDELYESMVNLRF